MVEAASSRVPMCFIGYFKEAAEWRDAGRPVDIVEAFPKYR